MCMQIHIHWQFDVWDKVIRGSEQGTFSCGVYESHKELLYIEAAAVVEGKYLVINLATMTKLE